MQVLKINNKELWVICQFSKNIIDRESLELMGKGAELARESGGRACVLLITEALKDEAVSLFSAAGADKIYFIKDSTRGFLNEYWAAREIARLAKVCKPEIIIFSSTIWGRSVAPQTAALLHTGITADCTGLKIDEDGFLVQTRPAFGASLLAEIVCKTRPQIVTVRSGIFPLPPMDRKCRGEIVTIDHSYTENKIIKIIGSSSFYPGKVRLCDAEIVISGGMGVGSKEGFKKLKQLAKLVKGAVGASRAAVDAGYATYDMQVGQTGTTVRPNLYIACGISGAVQHIAGMSGAEYVIAINTDPKAPIFQYADYGVVGDLHQILEKIIRFLKEDQIGNGLQKNL